MYYEDPGGGKLLAVIVRLAEQALYAFIGFLCLVVVGIVAGVVFAICAR